MSLIKEAITNGGRFVGNLLIKTSTRGVTNNGLPYYTVVFQDISGVLEAKNGTQQLKMILSLHQEK